MRNGLVAGRRQPPRRSRKRTFGNAAERAERRDAHVASLHRHDALERRGHAGEPPLEVGRDRLDLAKRRAGVDDRLRRRNIRARDLGRGRHP
jgi:hypothetical protein